MLAEIPVLIQVLLAPGVIVGWFAIIGLLSWLGGWSRLARVYRDEMSELTDGHTWRMQSVSLRGWCGYNNCVNIEATAKGLKIAPWFIMRPGHPPLFLPFDEMTSSSRTMLGVGLEQVRMKQEPAIRIDFRRTLVDSVRQELGDVWPEDSAGQSDAETGA